MTMDIFTSENFALSDAPASIHRSAHAVYAAGITIRLSSVEVIKYYNADAYAITHSRLDLQA